MHFFHLIQQSASHIHHSAIPLSPNSSKFHSLTFGQKTNIRAFYGRHDDWGLVVRTITTSSERFTCMTTFGHKIAVAYDDGTVDIYDSITGVLRLSLSHTDPVQAISGTPDGFVLFFLHRGLSITMWDMQTGGLIHTLGLGRNAEYIAVSLKGRYLACGLSNSSVEVWEVANKIQGSAIWTSSPATHSCWLGQEECIAVSAGTSVRVWDIAAGTTLWSFTIHHPAHRMVYSQKLNRLAVAAIFAGEGAVTIIDPQTGTSTTPHWIHQKLTCFAFSQTTDELVCGMETHGLQSFNLSTHSWKLIEYPDRLTSISSLPNGTVAVNFGGSGVQLLNLDEGYAASRQPTISMHTVRALDQGRIIATTPTSHDRIALLETSTMSQLFTIKTGTKAEDILVLCASLRNRMTLYYDNPPRRRFLQLQKFDKVHREWILEINEFLSIGGISPNGIRVVTFHITGNKTVISVRIASSGSLEALLQVDPIYPRNITFESDTRFYSNLDTHRFCYDLSRLELTTRGPFGLTGGGSQKKCYNVDDACEWVVRDSQRIFWIPPGYIGSIKSSYCWAGHSLIMAGQDGTLRKFTFREPT